MREERLATRLKDYSYANREAKRDIFFFFFRVKDTGGTVLGGAAEHTFRWTAGQFVQRRDRRTDIQARLHIANDAGTDNEHRGQTGESVRQVARNRSGVHRRGADVRCGEGRRGDSRSGVKQIRDRVQRHRDLLLRPASGCRSTDHAQGQNTSGQRY